MKKINVTSVYFCQNKVKYRRDYNLNKQQIVPIDHLMITTFLLFLMDHLKSYKASQHLGTISHLELLSHSASSTSLFTSSTTMASK